MFLITIERQRRGWSKSELARRSGVGLTEISRLESGKIYPYPGWKRRLAEALGCDPDTLFKKVDPEVN